MKSRYADAVSEGAVLGKLPLTKMSRGRLELPADMIGSGGLRSRQSFSCGTSHSK